MIKLSTRLQALELGPPQANRARRLEQLVYTAVAPEPRSDTLLVQMCWQAMYHTEICLQWATISWPKIVMQMHKPIPNGY